MPFFEGYALGSQFLAVFRCYGAAVAQENIHTFVFGEDRCAVAAFAGSEYYYTATCLLIVIHIIYTG